MAFAGNCELFDWELVDDPNTGGDVANVVVEGSEAKTDEGKEDAWVADGAAGDVTEETLEDVPDVGDEVEAAKLEFEIVVVDCLDATDVVASLDVALIKAHVSFPPQVYPNGQQRSPQVGSVPVNLVVFRNADGFAVAFWA